MEGVKLFPSIKEVFADNHKQNEEHFMPIASIDLALIDKSLKGEIHLVYYNNDPYNDESEEFYNDYCNDYKASFDIVNGKYKFKADYGFLKTDEDWVEWLEKGRKDYEQNIAKHKKKNFNAAKLIKNIGKKPKWAQNDQWPKNKKGEKLLFVCQAWSGDFASDYCEEEIFLFYDEANKMAVQIHQVD